LKVEIKIYKAGVFLFLIALTQSLLLSAQPIVTVQGSGKVYVQNNANAYVHGGLLFQNGSELSNTGIIVVKEIGAAGASNWTDQTATPYFHGNGTVIFNGTGGHTATSPNIFGKIHVNASGHLNHGSDLKTNNLLLDNGRVNTTAAYKMIVLTTAELASDKTSTNTQFNNSWVNGTLRRYLATSTVNNYIFPVGDEAKPNLAVMTSLTADPLNALSYVDASFRPKPGNDNSLYVQETGLLYMGVTGQYYTTVNNGGVWYLTPDVNPSAGKYDLLLYFNGFTGLTDNAFGILRRPNASSNANEWIIPISAGTTPSRLDVNNTPGRIVSPGFARRNLIGGFSQFGIGTFSAPLEYYTIDLWAERKSRKTVDVTWETKQEFNAKGFWIERRLDHESNYSDRGFVATNAINGNSEQSLRYLYQDQNDFAGISYYRIRQLFKNNQSLYTSIRAVKGIGEASVAVSVYPNPNLGQFVIRLTGTDATYECILHDMNGRAVRRMNTTSQSQVYVNDLPAGTYFLQVMDVFGKGQSFKEKIVVTR
jgi:hypothetical protein